MEKKSSAIDRLDHAFSRAEEHLGIERLLDPEGETYNRSKGTLKRHQKDLDKEEIDPNT